MHAARFRWKLLVTQLVALFVSASAVAHDGHADVGPRQAAPLTAEPPWTSAPLIVPAGGRQESGGLRVVVRGVESPSVQILSPEAPTQFRSPAESDGSWRIEPDGPGRGGYYLLIARGQTGTHHATAITAWNFPGKGNAPTALLDAPRPGLEVLPEILPEHGGYREGERHRFVVRRDGIPLPGATLMLETQSGTRSRVVADAQGIATVVFPRDFDPSLLDASGGMNRARQQFVLTASTAEGESHHSAAFNFFYYPDLARQRDTSAGWALLLAGMALATPLLFHPKGDAR